MVIQSFFAANRARMQAALSTDALLVLTANTSMQRSADASFAFAQEANFWYLTGIDAPDWWVIIDCRQLKSWLVSPDVSDVHHIFDGSLSAEEATAMSGIDTVISRAEAEVLLRDLVIEHREIYTLGDDPHAEHYDFALNPAPTKLKQRLDDEFMTTKDCRLDLAKLRAVKQPEELEIMQRAIDLTVESFDIVKQKLPQLRHEYEVEAEFSYYFRRNGAQGHAYDPIVASGQNACTLHYVANNDPLGAGELLVLDIGARLNGYAADITRTYAIGTLTDRQRAVHAAVQVAQQQIIALLGPGVGVKAYHEQVDAIMKRALLSLNLMQSMDDDVNYRRYFPHAISHGLGIDVHDSLGAPKEFVAGMVVTVEPGIYIPEESIGVRIEDDIAITETGYRNLSEALSTDW